MSEHESMNCGVVIVGAGPAGLSCALHLLNLINSHNQAVESGTKKAVSSMRTLWVWMSL